MYGRVISVVVGLGSLTGAGIELLPGGSCCLPVESDHDRCYEGLLCIADAF